MRRIAGTALIAVLLAIAPTGAAFSQSTERTSTTTATATVQAEQAKDDDGDAGLWGLFGLLGLAGLIPWRKTRERHSHQDTTRSTGM
ncbi:WGxxGxxG family protein [Streptomyces sp.]|uniref:WGxxGxxG family protein n=1 Tax=Streptomyces sp. TaxID=1931 RepID=UPI002810D237|nr:WGxxGxxG family protein [Streptomyces sp.]